MKGGNYTVPLDKHDRALVHAALRMFRLARKDGLLNDEIIHLATNHGEFDIGSNESLEKLERRFSR